LLSVRLWKLYFGESDLIWFNQQEQKNGNMFGEALKESWAMSHESLKHDSWIRRGEPKSCFKSMVWKLCYVCVCGMRSFDSYHWHRMSSEPNEPLKPQDYWLVC
jgi:hypothetical protein